MISCALSARIISRRTSLRDGKERGQASLEMLVVLMILIPLIFGGFELARGVAVRSSLDSGVGVAVRALSLDPGQWNLAKGFVHDFVVDNVLGGVDPESIVIQATSSACSDTDVACLNSLNFGDPFCLTGKADFTPDIPLMTTSVIHIEVEQCSIMEYMRSGG